MIPAIGVADFEVQRGALEERRGPFLLIVRAHLE